MGGNNDFFLKIERNKYLKNYPACKEICNAHNDGGSEKDCGNNTVNVAYNELGYKETSAIANIFSIPDLTKCIKSPSVITNCGYNEHIP